MDPTEAPALDAPSSSPSERTPGPDAPRIEAFRAALRWALGLGAAIVAAVAVVPLLGQGSSRDLAKGKPWRASSMLAECHPENITCGGGRTSIFFHTKDESQPWVEFDLGTPTRISEVKVFNRRDGDRFVLDRAVPLILEVGDDQKAWRVLGQRSEPFSVWTASFEPTTARYVRLRSPRTTMLHLDAVEIYR